MLRVLECVAKPSWAAPGCKALQLAFFGVFICEGLQPVWAAESPTSLASIPRHSSWNFSDVRQIPIQSGGRIKPLDSFARDTVLFITGSRNYKGWDPLDILMSWVSKPQPWEEEPFIQLTRQDVKRELGLEETRSRFSPSELIHNSYLAQYASQAAAPTEEGMKLSPREQELRRVLDRLGVFRSIVSGQGWAVIPKPAPAAWESLLDKSKEGDFIRARFSEMLHAYFTDDSNAFERAATLARAAVRGEISEWSESMERTLVAEVLYNRARPFQVAWILYLLAGLLWMIGISKAGQWLRLGMIVTSLGFFCHVGGVVLRCYIAGRPPVTNMYESVIWVCLGVLVFAGILYAIHKKAMVLTVACFLATLGMIAGDAAPAILDPGIHPLVPVLRSNYWLTIHVLTITLGYAAFALTLGLGNVTLYQYFKGGPSVRAKIHELNQLTYRAMQFGVVLLAAGTILGGIWADYSWGRFWGWDPKETWALIALLCYLVILHGRMTNWVGQFAFAVWTVLGFLSVLMAWYGVNFVLGAGLHSYGFASGGTPWILGFIGLQFLYVGVVVAIHSRRGEGKASRKSEVTTSASTAPQSHPR